MKGSGIYTKVSEIKDALGLTEQDAQRMEEVIRKYPMSVTDYYLSLIDPSDPKDPIRKCASPPWRNPANRECLTPAEKRIIQLPWGFSTNIRPLR